MEESRRIGWEAGGKNSLAERPKLGYFETLALVSLLLARPSCFSLRCDEAGLTLALQGSKPKNARAPAENRRKDAANVRVSSPCCGSAAFLSGESSDASDADSRSGTVRTICSRCTLAGNIVGHGERRMENGIAHFAAGEPGIAHCGHLRLHSRAQQQRATLRMTMAPHLGQETRKNISSDYETFSGMYAR